MCCIPKDSYKSIIQRQHENGGGLTPEIATRIAALTGVSPGHLLRNQIRPEGRRGTYTSEDYDLHQKKYNFSGNDWKNELINVVQTRFEEAVDALDEREGVSFLSALFFLSKELDKVVMTLGVIEDDEGNSLDPTIDELMSVVSNQVPDNTDQLVKDRFRRWEIEKFSVWMKQAEKEAQKFRRKAPKDRNLKGTKIRRNP